MLGFPVPAWADRGVDYVGAGSDSSCGTWLNLRQGNILEWSPMGSWALGYLSGVAWASETLNPLKDVDANAVWYWLDNYCRAHPTTIFFRALQAFVHEHPK